MDRHKLPDVTAEQVAHAHAAVSERFQLTPLGRRMLKGLREPLPLYAVDWRA